MSLAKHTSLWDVVTGADKTLVFVQAIYRMCACNMERSIPIWIFARNISFVMNQSFNYVTFLQSAGNMKRRISHWVLATRIGIVFKQHIDSIVLGLLASKKKRGIPSAINTINLTRTNIQYIQELTLNIFQGVNAFNNKMQWSIRGGGRASSAPPVTDLLHTS